MFVTSKGIIDGVIGDRFGGHGTQFNDHGMPTYSLPFKIEEAPERTVSFALVLEDKDAYPVTGGFAWIHWLAANITRTELHENESQTATDFVQGSNSWTSMQGGSQSRAQSSFYGGMMPPTVTTSTSCTSTPSTARLILHPVSCSMSCIARWTVTFWTATPSRAAIRKYDGLSGSGWRTHLENRHCGFSVFRPRYHPKDRRAVLRGHRSHFVHAAQPAGQHLAGQKPRDCDHHRRHLGHVVFAL